MGTLGVWDRTCGTAKDGSVVSRRMLHFLLLAPGFWLLFSPPFPHNFFSTFSLPPAYNISSGSCNHEPGISGSLFSWEPGCSRQGVAGGKSLAAGK
jgi:hypothetical protein